MYELSVEELTNIEGEGIKETAGVFVGTVGLAGSLAVGVVNPGVGLVIAGTSLGILDSVLS